MGGTYQFMHIGRGAFLPNKLCQEIIFTKNFVTYHPQYYLLPVINADKNSFEGFE